MNVIILLEYQGANSNALMFMNAIFLVTEEEFFLSKYCVIMQTNVV